MSKHNAEQREDFETMKARAFAKYAAQYNAEQREDFEKIKAQAFAKYAAPLKQEVQDALKLNKIVYSRKILVIKQYIGELDKTLDAQCSKEIDQSIINLEATHSMKHFTQLTLKLMQSLKSKMDLLEALKINEHYACTQSMINEIIESTTKGLSVYGIQDEVSASGASTQYEDPEV